MTENIPVSASGSYTNISEESTSEGSAPVTSGAELSARPANDPRALAVSQIGLPKDVVVALAAANIQSVADLMAADLSQVIQIEGVGRGSVRRMRLWLSSQGLLDATPPSTPTPIRRGTVRASIRRDVEVTPLPAGMENAPVPLNVLPARVANLLRKHHLTTMGRLHAVLSGPARFEGFGVGTRQVAIELLPDLFRAAALPQGSADPPLASSRSLLGTLAQLRSETRRPVRIEGLAASLEVSADSLRPQAEDTDEFLFIEGWCLLPDLQGIVDAGQVLPAGSVGTWILGMLAKTLNPIEHEVLVRWIGLNGPPERHAEIARSLSRSRERIRQLRERALLKVSAAPALYNVLFVLGRSISSKSEGRFIANFTIRHAVLLGAAVTPGLARLSVKLRT